MSFLPKMKVYVQLLNPGCHIYVNEKGDLFDLRAAQDVDLTCPQTGERYKRNNEYYRDTHFYNYMVGLGVRILLPKGCKGNLLSRSGTYNKFGVILANGEGKVDWPYHGPRDEWKANFIAFSNGHISGGRPATKEDYSNKNLTIINDWVQGDRVAQFEVSLSQKATFKQKLRWLLSSGIEIVYVDNIDSTIDRGGFNSSGVK